MPRGCQHPPAGLRPVNDPIDPDTLRNPRDAATFWLAREKSGRMDQAERLRFEMWLEASPEHDLEYRRAQGIWNAMRLIPEERLRKLAQEPAASGRRHFLMRRSLVGGMGAACTAALAIGIALPSLRQGKLLYTAEFVTRQGERRHVPLPDDSIIELNTATKLTVRLYAHSRVVVLESGEASFAVASDPQRPFLVEAGDTSVQVTGTRFDVRRNGPHVRVAVESGSVKVRHGPWWNRSTAALQAGQGASAQAPAGLAMIDDRDIAALTAWRQGRVVFRDTPLPEAIAEINRYANMPIRLDSSRGQLAGLRIAGVFSTDDTNAFLELLPDIAPVTVMRLADGTPLVTRR